MLAERWSSISADRWSAICHKQAYVVTHLDQIAPTRLRASDGDVPLPLLVVDWMARAAEVTVTMVMNLISSIRNLSHLKFSGHCYCNKLLAACIALRRLSTPFLLNALCHRE